MLAMRDEEVLIPIVIVGMLVMLVASWLRGVHKGRQRRLDVMQAALQSGNLDATTKRLLVEELTRPGDLVRLLQLLWSGGRVLVALGWVGVFIGIGITLAGGYHSEEVGVPFALCSFGVLTVPFALRELESRRTRPMPK